MSTATLAPGFYGKLPIRGDFVSRRLPRDFLESWDTWLQTAISQSRQQLNDRWLDCYLSSPLWRFALSPGVCGETAFAGVLMPSVDRVGRYYPLVIAAPLAGNPNLLTLLISDWFEQAEQVVLGALNENADLETFALQVRELGIPTAALLPLPDDNGESAWYCPLGELTQPARWNEAGQALSGHLLQRGFPHCSLWWSNGSHRVMPCLLVCRGLPPPQGFAALLAGDWVDRGWSEKGLRPRDA